MWNSTFSSSLLDLEMVFFQRSWIHIYQTATHVSIRAGWSCTEDLTALAVLPSNAPGQGVQAPTSLCNTQVKCFLQVQFQKCCIPSVPWLAILHQWCHDKLSRHQADGYKEPLTNSISRDFYWNVTVLNHKPCVYEPGTERPSENSVQWHSSSEISRRQGRPMAFEIMELEGQVSRFQDSFLIILWIFLFWDTSQTQYVCRIQKANEAHQDDDGTTEDE